MEDRDEAEYAREQALQDLGVLEANIEGELHAIATDQPFDSSAFSAALRDYRTALLAQVEITMDMSVHHAQRVAEAWAQAAHDVDGIDTDLLTHPDFSEGEPEPEP